MDDESPICKHFADSLDPRLSEDILQVDVRNGHQEIGSESQVSPTPSGITWYKASFLIVNAALGAGLLNFPEAFKETGGIISGNLAHLIFVILALVSLLLLSLCATEKDCKTYQEVVKCYCGNKWAVLCSVCITVYCFVTCITFIIIIGDQFDRAFASYFGPKFCLQWYLNRKFTMVVSSLFLIFPCCFKRIDGMQIMSYVGVASVWYLGAVIATETAIGNYPKGDVLILDLHLVKFFRVIPTICFGYQCHVSSVPILSCLKKRDKPEMIKACGFAIAVCFLVYTVSANCGYLTFGDLVSSDILLDYEARKSYVLLAVLLLAMKSWTTYPILLFCVREAVADLYLGWMRMDEGRAVESEPTRRKAIASILWLSSILLAVFMPGLNTLVKLLGSLAAVFILIFPGMCYIEKTLDLRDSSRTISGHKQFGKLFVSGIYIVVGTFSFGLALMLGLDGFLYPESDHPLCVSPIF